MNADEFRSFWDTNFGLCPPIGYLLRQTYHDRWFRIHSLPDSKRYAETEDEYREILRRHNTLIGDLLDGNSEFLLLMTEGSFDKNPVPVTDWGMLEDIHPQPVFSIAKHEFEEGDDTPWYWHIWINHTVWRMNCLDPLLRKAADWQIVNMGVVNVERTRLYFPYDGGGDVILNSQVERDRMQKRFTDWLSKHPLGL